jgi:phospholipid/cholesterol/gamma-HCH transport system permease protein
MYCEAQREGETLALRLRGDWLATTARAVERELQTLTLANARRLQIDATDARFDLSGAWLLHDLLQRARAQQLTVGFADAVPESLVLIERTLGNGVGGAAVAAQAAGPEESSVATAAVEGLGRRTVRGVLQALATLDFFGRVCVNLAWGLWHWRRWHPISIARHVYDTGITAIPIVALIAFLISVILAYIGAQQLLKFGADIFVVDLVTIGVLRELGVLLTAIIVAGRSGSAFAAEIGAMRLNEEVDALHATGVEPVEVLVVPRLIGLVIALPLLTVIADVVGLMGGGILCRLLLDMPVAQYLSRVNDSIASTTFWVGLIKAPVFAGLIAVSGTWCGMQVRGSSRDLGRLTTLAVVQSIFFVILADALFAVLFMEMDI